MDIISRFARKEIFRFMIAGTLSTVLMLIIYVLLSYFINYQIAYFLSYVFAVIFSYFINTIFVFKKRTSLKTFLSFPLIYLFQYVVGAVLLEIFARIGFSVTYAPIIIIILLLPLTFFLNKLIMKSKPEIN